MATGPVEPLASPLALPTLPGAQRAGDGASFGPLLLEALQDVSRSQQRADSLALELAAGGDVELHQVVLALEAASLKTHLALQVRNKALEAYQEIMRMPI
mgnify:CR=1 FL=1